MNINPYALLLEMTKSNPNMKPIVDQLEKGVNPESLFRSLCKQRNINPDEFIQELQKKYGNIR